MLGLQESGHANVILSDLHSSPHPDAARSTIEALDATDKEAQRTLFEAEDIEVVYNLVAMLSAKGEQDPMAAWKLNMEPLLHTLEMAREGLVERVFWPSSMAVFGADAQNETPNSLNPRRCTGCPKPLGNCSNYYHETFGVDGEAFVTLGSLDFDPCRWRHHRLRWMHFIAPSMVDRCAVFDPDERLPMMSMSDAVRGTLQLMEAPRESISVELWQFARV